ncbi:FecR domain-containing protein [Paenibacillus sp. MZ04-78.2]|uniref:FecR family protein n=1 Tax=Paenibacillus sp. MZ04-78.2 TaxID=2962034 RepID=UPI0020B69943|nr:FecR domain-containing protein [Paenibacillus sp. MZ04-78.2]MCP3772045.1 FecR domain-containing protein [Paenibacillus sp. MZ04-78.2]
MANAGRFNRRKRKPALWALVFAMALQGTTSIALASPANAKSARSAAVVEVTGEVAYKKSGGSRSYAAYRDLNLNQGDSIVTGPSSSVVLRVVDHEDEITIGANSEVYISELMEKNGGKKTKVKSWAGSLWAKIKSLVGAKDEFEVETPTAVMGVRGTNFMTSVNWKTGKTTMAVAAGVVSVSEAESAADRRKAQDAGSVSVYPAQQASIDSPGLNNDLRTRAEYADPKALVEAADKKVLESFIKNIGDIQKEQDKMKAQLQENLDKGVNKPDERSILKITTPAGLDAVRNNFDRFLSQLAKSAVDAGKLTQKAVDDANANIADASRKLDIHNPPALDKNAGIDPKVEQLKNQAEQKNTAFEQEQRQLRENQAKLAPLLDRIEADKQRIQDQNRKAVVEADQKATVQYTSTLSGDEKKTFEESHRKNTNQPAPDPSPRPTSPPADSGIDSGSGSGGGSTDERPSAPVLISPTAEATVRNPVQIKLKAAAGTTVRVLNGTEEVGRAAGQGESEVIVTLRALPPGTYKLTAQAFRESEASVPVSIPPIHILGVGMTQVGGIKDGKIGLALTMKGFTPAAPFYSVEAHLLYDKAALDYRGPADLTPVPGTVFHGSQAAETLRQISDTSGSELIYAATAFETRGSGVIKPIQLSGDTLLVNVPLSVVDSAAGSAKVDLAYIKVIDKQGNTVYESRDIQSSSVGTK